MYSGGSTWQIFLQTRFLVSVFSCNLTESDCSFPSADVSYNLETRRFSQEKKRRKIPKSTLLKRAFDLISLWEMDTQITIWIRIINLEENSCRNHESLNRLYLGKNKQKSNNNNKRAVDISRLKRFRFCGPPRLKC